MIPESLVRLLVAEKARDARRDDINRTEWCRLECRTE